MKIVAVEGPSFSGKTSTIARLQSVLSPLKVIVFDCYVAQITRAGDVPPARTQTGDEQLAAFELFMRIEAERVNRLADMTEDRAGVDLVILDRSVDTLLAHAHALDRLYGFGVGDEARARLAGLPHLVPDATFYLDAAPQTGRRRRQRAGEEFDGFLLDSGFLGHFRDYFLASGRRTVCQHLIVVPANGSVSQVAQVIGGTLWQATGR